MKPILLIATFVLSLSLSGEETLYNIPLKNINNKAASLKTHKGKVMLVVNVASQCGLTSQYKQLQAVYEKYSDKGFTVCGFPCNQFGKQEPGTLEEIKKFCSSKYDVSFPLYAKIDVNGDGAHPLYKSLKKQIGPAKISWNFEKFLVGKNGKVLKRFSPGTKPDAPEVIKAIETALK
jgi:glutathione peroxidase